MMSAPITLEPSAGATVVTGHREPLRLKLKPKTAIAVGQVDGAWWPRSRDLALELRALLPVLAVRLGRIERVTYHLGDWDPSARKIVVDGSVVRLGGFRSQRVCTVDVLAELHRVTLLVVPAGSAPVSAHRVMLTAGHRDNTDSVAELLSGSDLSF
jgi:Family of unknown function (DUF5994)